MPTLDELGQKVKAKYPQYADIPDAELGAKVKAKYPDAYKDFTAGPPTSNISVSDAAKQRLESMKRGPAKKQYEQAQESASKDIKRSVSTAAGETLAMAPFAIAAPFTAGASLPMGAAIMGGAGLAGGAIREGIEAIGGKRQSTTELLTSLGVDTVTGMLGEGIGRGLGLVTKTVLPRLILRSAARADGGQAVLDQLVFNTRRDLEKEIETYAMAGVERPVTSDATALVPSKMRPAGQRLISGARNVDPPIVSKTGTYWVDAGRPIKEAFDKITAQPQAAGEFGRRFSGMSPKAAEIVRGIEKDINLNNGSISNMQRLDHLVEIKGRLNQFAWADEGLTRDEKVIFKNLAGDVDSVVRDALKDVGPKAQELYKRANDVWKIQRETNVATKLAEKSVAAWLRRKAVGAGIGGAYGYYAGGGPAGAVTGAAIGVGMDVAAPKLAKLAVEQVMAHPEGAVMMKNAVRFFLQGDQPKGAALAARALAMAGVRNTVRKAMEQTDDEAAAVPRTP